MNPLQQLPLYQCHKQVRAAKIMIIVRKHDNLGNPNGYILSLEGFGGYEVSPEFMLKHEPKPGGYFVVYEDGYLSFSPAEAFVGGYTLAPENWQERLLQERKELWDKIMKLSGFFDSPTFFTLGKVDQTLLREQYAAMNEYLSILDDRIQQFAPSPESTPVKG